MATTFVDYTGDGNATKSFSFPSYQESDVKVRVDGVLKTTSTHYNITGYTTTGGGNVVFTSGNIPSSPAKIRIYRDTNVDAAKATFTAGSSVKAADLNNNTTQLLYRAQEEQVPNLIQAYDIDDSAITTAKIATDAISNAKLAENSVDSENYVDGSIDTIHIGNAQITTAKIAADAVTGAKIADDQINSEHYVDGSIDTAHIADLNITTAKIANSAVNGPKIATGSISHTKLAANAVETDNIADAQITTAKIVDSNVTTAKIADSNVTTAKLAADAVTNAKIADDSINSEHYVDGSIDTQHIADSNITTAKIADSNVTTAKIADSNVTTAKIADAAVTNAKIASNAVGTNKFINSSVTTDKINTAAITTPKLADNAVTTGKIADSELKTLAGMQSATASKLADSTALTADIADLNQIDGMAKQTTITDDDTKFPTSGAVVDYVAAQIAPIGGLEVIATEVAFPNTQPAAGVVISIADAGGIVVNGSGTSTTGRTVGGSTVTINNINSAFNSSTIDAGVSFMVSSTGSGQVYNFHKATLKEADILSLSNDINDFANRYRVGSSNPTTDLDSGDLFFNTGTGKLLVYNGTNSAWEEAQSIGNFFINTLSSSSGTGGGSATPNGSAYRFTLSNAGTVAQQHLVSVDGVVQKPNSGSSQPSEGFAIDGADIIFGAAPVSGASIFVVTSGSTVNIGTPSNNTVTSAILQNGSVTTAKIVDANVTTAKIAKPLDFADSEKARFGTGNDLEIFHDGSHSRINNSTGYLTSNSAFGHILRNGAGSETLLKADVNAAVELYYDNSKKFETTSRAAKVTGSNGSIVLNEYGHVNLQNTTGSATNYWSLAPRDTGAFTIAYGAFTSGTETVSQTHNVLSFDSNGHVDIPSDSKVLRIGASQDLSLWHDGTNSNIRNITNSLYIRAADVRITNAGATEHMAKFFENGQAELYFDNSKKLATASDGITVTGRIVADELDMTDGDKIKLGSSDDFEVFHNGISHNTEINHINNSGHMQIASNRLKLTNYDGPETYIDCISNGAVNLYHNNSNKFQTTSTGVHVDGELIVDGSVGDIKLNSSGAEIDFNRNGPCNLIMSGSGVFNILGGTPGSADTLAKFTPNGSVEIYYDNDKKLETTTVGINIPDSGNQTASSTHTNGALLCNLIRPTTANNNSYTGTYFMNRNAAGGGIKAVGIVETGLRVGDFTSDLSATEKIKLTYDGHIEIKDNGKLKIGNSSDLQIFHNTAGGVNRNDIIAASGTGIKIQTAGNNILELSTNSETSILCRPDGSTELYHDGTKKMETSSVGVTMNDTVITNGEIRPASDNNHSIGRSNRRYVTYFGVNGSINTSDRNEKNTIVDSDLGLDFVNKLKPISYKWNKDDGKTHYGLIAQDLEATLTSLGKTIADFGGIYKEDNSPMGLGYSELIAPLIKAVQELTAKVAALEAA